MQAAGGTPSGWGVRQLGELGSVVRGASPRPAGDPRFFDGDFIPWLTVAALTNIPDHQLIVYETATSLTAAGAQHSRTLPTGTLIIANSGATLGVAKLLGMTCCANDGIAAILNQQLGDKAYVSYCINRLTRELREVVATGNGQPNLNTGLIREIAIPFPPAAEQRAIAEALGDVDTLLAGLDRLIAKKRDLIQAAMQQLLTGQMRLKGLHTEWVHTTLGELFAFKNGLNKAKHFFGFGTPIVNYMDVFSNGKIVCTRLAGRVSLSKQELSNFDVRKGDVLFTRTSETPEEVGLAAVIGDEPSETVFSGFLLRARPRSRVLCDEFKAYCFRSSFVRSQIVSKASYTTRALTNGRLLSGVVLPVPPLAEQAAIAAALSDMDTEILALETRRDKTRALKQAMMQELLNGRIRLI